MSNAPIPEPAVAIMETAPEIQCLVHDCTECSRNFNSDGKPNVAGMIHRQEMTKTFSNAHGTMSMLDCSNCPIHLRSVRTGEFDLVIREIDGEA